MLSVAFIGSVGLPNRYGGFEAFLEHTAPALVKAGVRVIVTCDAAVYPGEQSNFYGVERLFVHCPANGSMSVIHDLLAFFSVLFKADNIIVMGVSGGIWFPLFRTICSISGKNLCVNVDGVEWKRGKFSLGKRAFLWVSDMLAQTFAHCVIVDNKCLVPIYKTKSKYIAYPGDHILRSGRSIVPGTALTICRIEPENNIELLIEGFLQSHLSSYTIIGNWNKSLYGQELRNRFRLNQRLRLLDPIYDPEVIANFRETCQAYIHGHSVGGTNPSLVEMIYYDADLFCFDVPFHRATLNSEGNYFKDTQDLAQQLDGESNPLYNRNRLRGLYSLQNIKTEYLNLLR